MTPPSDLGRLENARQELELVAKRAQDLAGELSRYRQTLGRMPERILDLIGGSGQGVDRQVANNYVSARSAVAAAETALAQARGLALKAASEMRTAIDKEKRH